MSAAHGSVRLDQALVERGLASSRAQAQALVLAGRVRSGGRRLDKAGARIAQDAELEIEPGPRYVGRGGHKLRGALDRFGLTLRGCVVLDVGASTGGFTQVALEDGARRVLAVDVGRGQLDWTLRQDDRVAPIEGINARRLTPADLPETADVAVVDVSFISLTLILPPLGACLIDDARVLALVKPQFEVGRRQVGRGGIVRDPALHRSALISVAGAARAAGWIVAAVAPSAIRGAEGNVEFFIHLARGDAAPPEPDLESAVDAAIREAHDEETSP